MDKIYREDPTYWPEGLSIAHHDDVYMIRSASTNEAVGFTGWQTRKEGSQRVGYYTIGILPEHRRNGMAKAALSQLISKKAATVDKVRAYVAAHNQPSLALAESLDVPVIKAANVPSSIMSRLAPSVGGAAGNAAVWDWASNEHQPWQADYWKNFDKNRVSMGVINAFLGAVGGETMGQGFRKLRGPKPNAAAAAPLIGGGAATIALSPVKDWLVQSLPAAGKLPEMVNNLSQPGMSDGQRTALLGLGGAGLAALGYGGYKTVSALRDLVNVEKQRGDGRLKVTLPTKDPSDRETTIDIPFREIGVSDAQKVKLTRDLRRRIYKETKERTMQRQKGNKNKAPKDSEKKASMLLPSRDASISRLQALIAQIYG